jgi:hypothetical protein
MSAIDNLPSGAVIRRPSRNGNDSFQMLASLPLNAGNALGLGSYVSTLYNIDETSCSPSRQALGVPGAPGQAGPKAIALSNATAQVVLGENGKPRVRLLFDLNVKRDHTASDGFVPVVPMNGGDSASAVSNDDEPQWDTTDMPIAQLVVNQPTVSRAKKVKAKRAKKVKVPVKISEVRRSIRGVESTNKKVKDRLMKKSCR